LIDSLISVEPEFASPVSAVELVWVLSSCCALARDQLGQALDVLLCTKQLVVDQSDQVVRALRFCSGDTNDFTDCLIERITQMPDAERP
jgi:predicted nucleic-acid-binding protein